ncbi:uncharacterized protein K441DRAFT_658382 [Cenococcum geophilum 1.58]|uniref:uncharacterized protein n=1 Tax=Cenococcum geophilum 1.58 TaxID=794803 RepID=UPI00358EBFDC|nr:hypothetical protein K441DRAFT_658382 [Cenococcum geophilum 1.58]
MGLFWARYSTKGTSTSRTPAQALFILAGEVSSNLATFPIPRILRTTFIALTQILDISHLASRISPLHLNRSYYTSRWLYYRLCTRPPQLSVQDALQCIPPTAHRIRSIQSPRP